MLRLGGLLSLFVALLVPLLSWLAPTRSLAEQGQGATVVYNLYATDGYYELPDGRPLYFYGLVGGREGQALTYQSSCAPGTEPGSGRAVCTGAANVMVAGGPVAPRGGPQVGQEIELAGNAQFPAPILYARVGDLVEIRFKNLGPARQPSPPGDPHNVHLHALDIDTAAGGLLQTSLEAVPANLCADGTTAGAEGCGLVGPAPDAGRVVVYLFSPSQPGTYLYYGHRDIEGPVPTAIFGALVVYDQGDGAAATGGPGQGLGGTLYGAAYDREYVLLLSEFHRHGDQDGQAQYWAINGLSFPQTIHAAFPSGYAFDRWLAAHPGYDPLVGSTGSGRAFEPSPAAPGNRVLLRVLNAGLETHTLRMAGGQGQVIGSDQRGWFWTNNVPLGQGLETDTLTIGSGETYDWLVDLGQFGADPASPYVPLYNVDADKTATDGVSPGGMLTFVLPGR